MCVVHVHGVCLSSEVSWIVEIYQILLLHTYNFTLHAYVLVLLIMLF